MKKLPLLITSLLLIVLAMLIVNPIYAQTKHKKKKRNVIKQEVKQKPNVKPALSHSRIGPPFIVIDSATQKQRYLDACAKMLQDSIKRANKKFIKK